ncbi:hypothetical protein E0K83_04240 [Gramella sp. BOM4]|nr:hypothetical protein [Christiangramia bathymodioli]
MEKTKIFETIIVLALAGLIGFLIFDLIWLVYLVVILLAIPLISVKAASYIAKFWMAFSFYLSTVMNHILLFICFYMFLVPLSFLQKLFGSNQILKKQEGDSYFQKRDHVFTSRDIDRPW